MSETEPLNPYAPPEYAAHGKPVELPMWREGDLLVVRRNALQKLHYCLKTGEPTTAYHPISQIWQPAWVYRLLFFFVFPYFLVSPLVHRRVEMSVPVGPSILKAQRHVFRTGVCLIILGAAFLGGFIVGAMNNMPANASHGVLLLSVLAFLAGVQIAGRSPVKLDIHSVDGELVYLRGVHPTVLDRVPAIGETAESE